MSAMLFFEDKINKVKEGYTDIAMAEVLLFIEKYKNKVKEIDKIVLKIESRIITNLSEYQAITKSENTGIVQFNEVRSVKNRINNSFVENLNELHSNISFCNFLELKRRNKMAISLMWLLLLLGLLAIFIIFFFKSNRQAPKLTYKETENKLEAVEVFSLNRTLDLREWQFVSKSKEKNKISKGVFTDTYKLRKNNSETKEFLIKHATSGILSPEFILPDKYSWRIDSISNSKPVSGSEKSVKVYDIYLNLDNFPIGIFEEVELSATYWNAFNNDESAWSAVPVLYPIEAMTFKIYFPKDRPFNEFQREASPRGENTPIAEKLVNTPFFKVSEDRRFIEWNINNAHKNWIYTIRWNW